jgi:hypothetical protein
MTEAEMQRCVQGVHLDEYNGDMVTVSGGRVRDAGFVMTGKSEARVAERGSVTAVRITLRRAVAKVMYRMNLIPANHNALTSPTLVITSATISGVNAESYLMEEVRVLPLRVNYGFTQPAMVRNGYVFGQFFIYEHGACTNDKDKPLLTLSGYVEPPKNSGYIGYPTKMEYKIALEGSGSGEFRRNGCYMADIMLVRIVTTRTSSAGCSADDYDIECEVTTTEY